MSPPDRGRTVLFIDLGAVAANYRLLSERLNAVECAGVVKADAYGLGMEKVARRLAAEGCRRFFVALVEEGVALRELLPEAEIHVFNGLAGATEDTFIAHDLLPVLNDLGQIEAWAAAARARDKTLRADVHIDTGMSRLGLTPAETARLAAEPERLDGIGLAYWISHLACADEPEHAKNREQLETLKGSLAHLPPAPVSFANSSGVFLGSDYHFDLGRPGAALYGINPVPGRPNPMAQPVRLEGRILQVRDVDSPMTVGYGATHRFSGPRRLATVAAGYADGYFRSLSNRGSAYVGDVRVPVVGRVSMDLITLDVSDAPPDRIRPGAFVELIGPRHTADDLAAEAGTIAYEILTSLGRRYRRVHVGEAD